MITDGSSTGTKVTITQEDAGWDKSGITEIAGLKTTDTSLSTLTNKTNSNGEITVTVDSNGKLIVK